MDTDVSIETLTENEIELVKNYRALTDEARKKYRLMSGFLKNLIIVCRKKEGGCGFVHENVKKTTLLDKLPRSEGKQKGCNIAKNSRIDERKRITDLEMQKYLGLPRGAFSNWKRGMGRSYYEHISKIADRFEVNIDYLVCDEDIKRIR